MSAGIAIEFHARFVLAESENTEHHRILSAAQAAAIMETVQSTESLTATMKAEMCGMIVSIKWHNEQDRSMVLATFAPPTTARMPPGKRRRAGQDFGAIHHYGDEQFWETWSKPMSSPAKLSTLLQFAIRLGLRCPTEPTIKWLTSMWVCSTTTFDELQSMDPVTKSIMLKHVKANFDPLRRAAPEPVEFIELLPAESAAYVRDHKRLFDVAFPTSTPVLTRLDVAMVMAFDQSFGCRGSGRVLPFGGGPKSGAGTSTRAPHALQLSPRRSEGLAMERVANQVMKQMETMATQQQRLMEFMFAQSGGGVRLPKCLDDRRPMPQLALEGPPGCEQPLGIMQCLEAEAIPRDDLPPPPQHALVPATPKAIAAIPHLNIPPVKPSAVGTIDDLVDAFIARRKDKAVAKKETVAVEVGGDDATPTMNEKAKSKAKAKAAALHKANVISPGKVAKLISPPCKPKHGEAKHVSPPCKKATEKSKKDLIVGCAKCRWSVSGCAQCKNRAFTGYRWNQTSE